MGRTKQLVEIDGVPMVQRTVRGVETAQLDDVVVVVGHEAAAVIDAVSGGRCRTVLNPDYAEGNVTSLLTGLREAGEAAVVLVLADMPGVDPAVIDRHVDCWRRHRPHAAVTAYRDGLAHPFLLSPDAVAEVTELEGTKPLWVYLTETVADRVAMIEVDDPRPDDINTPDDLSRHRS